MSTLPLFLTQSQQYLFSADSSDRPFGNWTESFGMPLLLAAFAATALIALLQQAWL